MISRRFSGPPPLSTDGTRCCGPTPGGPSRPACLADHRLHDLPLAGLDLADPALADVDIDRGTATERQPAYITSGLSGRSSRRTRIAMTVTMSASTVAPAPRVSAMVMPLDSA